MLAFLGSSDCVILLYTLYSPIQLRLYSLSKRRDVLYVCAGYLYNNTTLVCLLLSTSIPTSFFNFKQLFFILVTDHIFMILDHSFNILLKLLSFNDYK